MESVRQPIQGPQIIKLQGIVDSDFEIVKLAKGFQVVSVQAAFTEIGALQCQEAALSL